MCLSETGHSVTQPLAPSHAATTFSFFRNQVQFSRENPHSPERERESRRKSSVAPSSGRNCLQKAVRIKPWGDVTLQEINECEANAFKRNPSLLCGRENCNTEKGSVTKDPKEAVDSLQGRKQSVYKDAEK